MKKIVINERCKGCGICSAFCPRLVLEWEKDSLPVPTKPEACSGCKLCVLRCPDFAVTVEDEQ